MTGTAQPQSVEPRASRQWLVPFAGILVVLAALAAVIVLARDSGKTGAPRPPGPFERPAEEAQFAVYTVSQVAGGRLQFSLTDGAPAPDVAVPPGARIEVLRPARASDLQPGDWVTVFGVTNEVLNFAIRFVVAIPGGAAGEDSLARSPGGFTGHEANAEPEEAPIVSGRVVSVSGTTITMEGPSGTMTIDAGDGAPLFRLTEGTLADIREGDRVAFPASGGRADPAARAVLVGFVRQ